MEVLAAILGAIGFAFAAEGASDIVNGVGQFANKKWRSFIKELQKVINENSQYLSDFKTKSETEKAQIAASLLNGAGLGPRANVLKSEYNRLVKQDKEITDRVTKANNEAYSKISDAENLASNATRGIIGAGEAVFRNPNSAQDYKVNDPNQNISAGLQGGTNDVQKKV